MPLLFLIRKQKQYKEFLFEKDKFTFDFFLPNAVTCSDSWLAKKKDQTNRNLVTCHVSNL